MGIKELLMGEDSGSVANLENVSADPATPEQKRGRGRPAGTKPSGFSVSSSPTKKAAGGNDAKMIDDLFSPANFKALVRVPADIRLAVTGRKHWELKDSEVDTLAITASTTAKYFSNTDPKWLAVSMLCMNVCMIYGARIIEDVRLNRDAENKNRD